MMREPAESSNHAMPFRPFGKTQDLQQAQGPERAEAHLFLKAESGMRHGTSERLPVVRFKLPMIKSIRFRLTLTARSRR
jgi:hypothetical protein